MPIKIKYFDNDPQHGIIYDWDLIEKEYRKLSRPKNAYNPFDVHTISSGRWIVDLSERNTGKSTNWLLLAMVMHKLYNIEAAYIREIVDMIMPKHAMEMFNTILSWGYVQELTDGQYDSIVYESRRYYYINSETREKDPKPFLVSLSLDENELNKSSLQLPDTDIIMFDEFISRRNYSDEFPLLCDTIKTIIRERDAPLIVLMANTIQLHSFWFKELTIYDDIQNMIPGDRRELVTMDGTGTIVDFALIGNKPEEMTEHKKKHNARFFGFPNPKLNSIRGGGWAIRVYPHPPRDKELTTVCTNRYIRHNGYILQLELVYSERMGYYVIVHPANQYYDDSVIYCLDIQLEDRRFKFKWGLSKLDKKYLDLWKINKWFYATNLDGTLVDDYMRNMEIKKVYD